MSKIVLSVLILNLAITVISCNEDPVSVIDNGFKDRNITWSTDTLDLPVYDWIYSFRRSWGGHSDDIWLTASSTSVTYEVWHYEGEEWKSAITNSFHPSLGAIYGFSDNDIWSNAGFGHIYHYNGTKWEQQCTLKVEGYTSVAIQNIGGKSPNDICAVGFVENELGNIGVIFHYDGKSWELDVISEDISTYYSVFYDNSEQSYIVSGNSYYTAPYKRLYKYDPSQHTLQEFYTSDYGFKVLHINGEVYFQETLSNNQKCFNSINNGQIERIYDFSDTGFKYVIGGYAVDDLFCRIEGGIGHFNGEDFALLYEADDAFIATHAIFHDEVFFPIQNSNDNTAYILHGIKQ